MSFALHSNTKRVTPFKRKKIICLPIRRMKRKCTSESISGIIGRRATTFRSINFSLRWHLLSQCLQSDVQWQLTFIASIRSINFSQSWFILLQYAPSASFWIEIHYLKTLHQIQIGLAFIASKRSVNLSLTWHSLQQCAPSTSV